MKRYGFIYNPAARRSQNKSKFEVLSRLVEQMPGSKVFYSESRGHISELVDEVYPDFDVIVACGGDGTVREVASQLVDKDKTLGIIPLGSGNDLCKTLNIPTDLNRALQVLLRGEEYPDGYRPLQ